MTLTTRPALRILGVVAVVVTISLAGSILFFYLRHHDSRAASVETSQAEFLKMRTRFAAQQPLLDMRERKARQEEAGAGASSPLRLFHTTIFDTRRGHRLIHMTVPYWFARRYAGQSGQFKWLGELTFLDDTEFDPEPIQLSLEQIERHGPGLIVDYQRASGGQFIAWVE